MSTCTAAARSSAAFAVFVVTVAVFTDIFLYNLIIPELPMMLEDGVGIPTNKVQFWTSVLLSGYGGAYVLTPIFLGAYIDRTNSKQTPFMIGLIVMAASTILFYTSTHITLLVAGRALQGASGAFVWTSGMSFLNARVGSEAIAAAMGWVMIGAAGGEVLGPIAGGLLYEHAGHSAVFAVAVAVIAIDIVLRLLLVAETPQLEESRTPTIRQVECGATGLLECHDSSTGRDSYGATDPYAKPIGERSNGGISDNKGSQQSIREVASNSCGSKKDQELPQSILLFLLSDMNLLCSLWAVFMTSTTRTALETTLPLYLQSAFNWSSSGSGFVILCLVAPALLGPVTGPIIDRFGPRWLSSTSFFALGPLFIALGFAKDDSLVIKISFCGLIICIGVCLFITATSHMAAVAVAAERASKSIRRQGGQEHVETSGKAYALMSMVFGAGMLCGPIWAGQVKERFGWPALSTSFSLVEMVSGVFMALSWRTWSKPSE